MFSIVKKVFGFLLLYLLDLKVRIGQVSWTKANSWCHCQDFVLLDFVPVKTNSTSRENIFLKFDNVYYFGTSLIYTTNVSYVGKESWSIFALEL